MAKLDKIALKAMFRVAHWQNDLGFLLPVIAVSFSTRTLVFSGSDIAGFCWIRF